MFCCKLLYVPPCFAIILMGKREPVALLNLSSRCLVIVVWLFLAVPWVCLQFVIVVFPDHTHLLFLFRFDLVGNPEDKFICSYHYHRFEHSLDHSLILSGDQGSSFRDHFLKICLSIGDGSMDFLT